MNSIGIDFQTYATVMCLRESYQTKNIIHLIGDGISFLIPNIITDPNRWGNIATTDFINDQKFDGIFNNPDTNLKFWRNLYHRIYNYLGYLEPNHINGYHLTVGSDIDNSLLDKKKLKSIISEAGFNDFDIVPSVICLLARWIKQYKEEPFNKKNISVVVLGESSTFVCSFRISISQKSGITLEAASSIAKLIDIGLISWLTNILEKVDGQDNRVISNIQVMKSYDAMLRFGLELKQSIEGQTIQWVENPNSLSRSSNAIFTKNECAAWSESTMLSTQLPDLIKESLSEIAAKKIPDIILIGGPGAIFPFGSDAVKHLGRLWSSNDEINDIAKGAAWFFDLPETFRNELLDTFKDELMDSDTNFQKNMKDDYDLPLKYESKSHTTIDDNILPPWLRK